MRWAGRSDPREMSEIPPMPEGEYDLIYADPPWEYRDKTTDPSRDIENHYPTMDLEDIKALDPPTAEDCILYLWTTAPKTAEAVEVVNAWGFDYRTNAIWDKRRLGLGHWFRVEHEILFVAVKGDASPPEEWARRGSIFRQERTGHSEKPSKVREHIEKAHPEADKLELFSRDGRIGWDMWGNEAKETDQATMEWVNEQA